MLSKMLANQKCHDFSTILDAESNDIKIERRIAYYSTEMSIFRAGKIFTTFSKGHTQRITATAFTMQSEKLINPWVH